MNDILETRNDILETRNDILETKNDILEMRDVSHIYATKKERKVPVLHHISLSLKAGETVSLLGDSGSGKSTLLHLAGLLESPTKGDIIICGEHSSKFNLIARARLRCEKVGFVFQFHHLIPEFNAVENLALAQQFLGVRKSLAIEKAEHILIKLGLKERLHHLPSNLSGGEQQRVAIGRALINEPALILADEPTGSLDTKNGALAFSFLCTLAKEQGSAILIATHNEMLAKKTDKQIFLQDGQLSMI